MWSNLKSLQATKDSSREKYATQPFSPDGAYVAYVMDNNLYIYDISEDAHIRITIDGSF